MTPSKPPSGPKDDEAADLDREEGFFDPSILADLEELAAAHRGPDSPLAISLALNEKLATILGPVEREGQTASWKAAAEQAFASLPAAAIAGRLDRLLEVCRQAGTGEVVRTIESFIIFFQALLPTVPEDGALELRRLLFHLAPILVQIAYNGFSTTDDRQVDGRAALQSLESVLIEISGVRLTPTERQLAFESIDQMAAFIGVGEYAMAAEIISAQLLAIISRNKLMRALFRLMEVEVSVQRYFKEKLGCATPKLRIPEDYALLADYGPIRVLKEVGADGHPRSLIQVQIPHIPLLRNVVLHLASVDGARTYDLGMDALGSAEVDVPPGEYSLGLAYQPD